MFCINLYSNILLTDKDKISDKLPYPYDGKIYTVKEIENFINKSIDNSKQPILIFGANWCPDCRIFSGTMDIPKIKKFIDINYDVLYIDVKRYQINMSLLTFFKIPSEEGIPRILAFDKDKNIINISNTTEWRTARTRTSQEIFNFFQEIKSN